VCTQERILKIFRITGLAGFFDIHPSIEAAMQVEPDGSRTDSDDPDDDTAGTTAPPAPGS
jgi:hypothetical protein